MWIFKILKILKILMWLPAFLKIEVKVIRTADQDQ